MLKKVLVLVSFLILVALVWRIPFMGTRVSDLPSGGTPKLSPALSKIYSGILYKIEKKADGGSWFTVLVDEDKTVKRVEADITGLEVGDGVSLTETSILKQDRPLLGTVTGKVVSASEKRLVLDWHRDYITVNIGETAKFSYKYDKETNAPGERNEIRDLSQIKVDSYVIVGIDTAASSESLIINTVQVLN